MILNILNVIKTLGIIWYFVVGIVALIIGMDIVHNALDTKLFYFGVKLVLGSALCLGIGLIFFV